MSFLDNAAALVKTLTATIDARLSAVRAAKIDNADVATSTRAPSSTALDNTVWTNPKAAFIDGSILSRAAATTALSNAVWTDAKAALIRKPLVDLPPTSIVGPSASAAMKTGSNSSGPFVRETDQYASASGVPTGSFSTRLNLSGSGVIYGLFWLAGQGAANNLTWELEIDGVVVHTWTGAVAVSPNYTCVTYTGRFQSAYQDATEFFAAVNDAPIPFHTSAVLRVKLNSGTGSAATAYYRYKMVA